MKLRFPTFQLLLCNWALNRLQTGNSIWQEDSGTSDLADFPGGLVVKKPEFFSGISKAGVTGDPGVGFLASEDILEKKLATDSSILAWKNPKDRGTGRGPWGLQSLTSLSMI